MGPDLPSKESGPDSDSYRRTSKNLLKGIMNLFVSFF